MAKDGEQAVIAPAAQETLMERVKDGSAGDSTESDVRYAAYAARARTILISAHRYVAYTSDIGESFRPIAHPYLIKGAYAVSWMYLAGDVAHEGYKAFLRNQEVTKGKSTIAPSIGIPRNVTEVQTKASEATASTVTSTAIAATTELVHPTHVAPIDDYRTVMAQRAIFQSLASMGLPAFTIHSVVKYSGKALKNNGNKTIRTWGPVGLGLAIVPALPYMFDKPVEEAVEWVFHRGFAAFGADRASGESGSAAKEKQA